MKRELIEFGSNIRVENGPKRKRDIATKELLRNDRTKDHYQESRFDAAGNRIELGKPMEYLDYLGEWEWILYERRPVMIDKAGRSTADEQQKVVMGERFMPIGRFSAREDAVAKAQRRRISRGITGFFAKPEIWKGEDL